MHAAQAAAAPRSGISEYKLTPVMSVLLFLWFFLTGITLTGGDDNMQSLAGRLALPDILMLVLAPTALWFASRRKGLLLPRMAFATSVLLLWFCIGIPTSTNPFNTLFECIVTVYAFLGMVVVYVVMRSLEFEERLKLLQLFAVAVGLIAVLGIYDWAAVWVGTPRIGKGIEGGLSGTFRNTGQAGQFFLFSLSAVYPFARIAKGKRQRIAVIATIVLVAACLLTIKRAAIIGLVIGFVCSMLAERDIKSAGKMLFGAAIAALLVSLVWNAALENIPGFRWRVESKLTGDGASSTVENFASSNLNVADLATKTNPITGVGVGGVAGEFAKYEIHSTYLGILVNSGLFGVLIYIWFFYEYASGLKNPRNSDPRSKVYSRFAVALMIGMAVSWIYTYHVRKREYWATVGLSLGLLAPFARQSEEKDGAAEALPEPTIS